MADQPTCTIPAKRKSTLSLDVWAVLLAIVLAALVRTGILQHIPW